MIRAGFLDRESRQDLIELTRDGSAAHRLARRANALVLLDDGMSFEAIAKVLLLDKLRRLRWPPQLDHRLVPMELADRLGAHGTLLTHLLGRSYPQATHVIRGLC